MFKLFLTLSLGLLLAVTTAQLTGCSTVTAEQIRMNPTPELQSTAMSSGQRKNNQARVVDNNLRGIWDDGARLLFFDRTLPASPYPTP